MGVILECTYLFRSNVIVIEVIVRFADGFAVCTGESDIAVRTIRNHDFFKDFACFKRFNGLRIAVCRVSITVFFVERHFDIGESVLRFVLKIDFLAGIGNLLGDIGVGLQATAVPGVCAILQVARIKDMVPHGINKQPWFIVIAYRPIHFNAMTT